MRVVIVGTGTNIGKTHLGVTLLTALARRGESACGLKPIESGAGSSSMGPDAQALAAAGTSPIHRPPPYAFRDPVSPHLAARRAGIEIDMGRVREWVGGHSAAWVLLETAGALLSPLARGLTNLEMAEALTPDAWLLVGVDRLGVLHDVTACQLALKMRLSQATFPLVVVLQAPPLPDDSTGSNAEELRWLGLASQVFAMPRGEPTSAACQAVAKEILDSLVAPSAGP